MRAWPWQRWVVALAAAALVAALIGVPTGVIPTRFYVRMTPVLWWSYPVLAASALLTGLVAATYVRRSPSLRDSGAGQVGAGGVLSGLAVGCPICNKLIVGLLGVSGALNLWAPVQPLLAVVGLVLLAYALVTRLRREKSCTIKAETTTEASMA